MMIKSGRETVDAGASTATDSGGLAKHITLTSLTLRIWRQSRIMRKPDLAESPSRTTLPTELAKSLKAEGWKNFQDLVALGVTAKGIRGEGKTACTVQICPHPRLPP